MADSDDPLLDMLQTDSDEEQQRIIEEQQRIREDNKE